TAIVGVLRVNHLPAESPVRRTLVLRLGGEKRLHALVGLLLPIEAIAGEGEDGEGHRRCDRPPHRARAHLWLFLALERHRFADYAAALLARCEVRRNRLELLRIEFAIDKGREQFSVAVARHRVGHRETSPRAATEPSSMVDGRKTGVPSAKSSCAP